MKDLENIIEQFVFSGQEPFKIAKGITKFIEDNFTPKKKEPKIPPIDWIKEWLELFPVGVKTGGKLVRSDSSGCDSKMNKFIKLHPAYSDKELILNVTREYIAEFEDNDYMYMKAATYFIDKKGEGSELAARCEEYLNKDIQEIEEKEQHYFL